MQATCRTTRGGNWVESEEKVGSTCFFTLPRTDAQPQPLSELMPISQVKYDSTEVEEISAEVETSGLKILIVDDDHVNRQVLKNNLGLYGYKILKRQMVTLH